MMNLIYIPPKCDKCREFAELFAEANRRNDYGAALEISSERYQHIQAEHLRILRQGRLVEVEVMEVGE